MNRSIEFWSSVELGAFGRGLIRELGVAGWNASHRFEVTEETYRAARNPIERTQMRWRCYVSYVVALRRRLLQQAPPAAIVVCTNTFYAPAVALRAARRLGIPLVHWVFDLFPDVLIEGGKLRPGGRGERYLATVTRSTFGGAAANVFLGERLLVHARKAYGEIPGSVVIPVGADAQPFETAVPQQRPPGASLRLLYCGNLGRMHDTQTILSLLKSRPPSGWEMEFRGHGSGFRSLAATIETSAVDDRVVLGESLRDEEWVALMKAADVAIVTMKPGAERVVMPSKTYSAMVAGQAILAICPKDSDLADTVRRHDAGWVIEPGDVSGLAAVLAGAAARPAEVLAKRLNSFRAGHASYDQRSVAALWGQVLQSLDQR